ncbi:MAG: FAD/NAD(P)-binding protein [Granulosicoccus sp.]|nr:FAD/NAD(P)-binding protein [Granulosicoccus sp.]
MKKDNNKALYVADVAFVGLGLSNAMTFLNYLHELVDEPPLHTMRLLLIERHPEHFTGVAYGPRSGTNALIINTLEEFIGDEERREFIAWIRKNEERLLKDFERAGGELSAQWIKTFRNVDEKTLETSLCVPRMFFGYWLREQVFSMLTLATELGVVDVQAVTDEVLDMSQTPIGYSLDVQGQPWSLLAEKIVLGVGPPACRKLPYREGLQPAESKRIVDNPYEHSICKLTVKMAHELCQKPQGDKPVNVLIVGSNASALESSYLLFDQPGFQERVNKVFVLSPVGKFPNRRLNPVGQPAFEPVHLNQLKEQQGLKAKDIYTALEQDLKIWKQRLDCEDLPLFSSNKELMALVNSLDRTEKQKFASIYGVMIGKYQRRAGDEYLDMADSMERLGKLEHVAGRIVEITSCDATGSTIRYTPADSVDPVVFHHPLSAIINCMGPVSLQDRQSELIENLIHRGICTVNSSGRGFVVGDDYSAAPNLIVTGPLISGNVIRDQPVWHVEHAGRLTGIAKDVASKLHGDIVETFILTA